MNNDELTRRLRALEAEVEEIREQVAVSQREKKKGDLNSWRATAGMFAGDPWFEDVVRLGREYRESLRPGRKKADGSRTSQRRNRKAVS
jgi:hypothetical protein